MTIVLAKRQFGSDLVMPYQTESTNPWHSVRGASLLRLQFRHGVLVWRVSGIATDSKSGISGL